MANQSVQNDRTPDATTQQSASPQASEPKPRGMTRRRLLVGAAGLAVAGGAVWFLRSLSRSTTLYTYRGHHGPVKAVGWSPAGQRIASAGDDRTVQVWGALNGAHVSTYPGHTAG